MATNQNLTRNQILGIPDGVDPQQWLATQWNDQQGFGSAMPGGMDPGDRAWLAQMAHHLSGGDMTGQQNPFLTGMQDNGNGAMVQGGVNDQALNDWLQQRYGTPDVLSRYTDTGGFVTGAGVHDRELYAGLGDGSYRPTGDRLTTENDVTGDLIASILTAVGGPIAGAYGTAALSGTGFANAAVGGAAAGGGAGAGVGAGADALASYYGGLGGVEGSIAGSGVVNPGFGAAAGAGGAAGTGGIGTMEAASLTPLSTPSTFAPMTGIDAAGAAGGAAAGGAGSGTGGMNGLDSYLTGTGGVDGSLVGSGVTNATGAGGSGLGGLWDKAAGAIGNTSPKTWAQLLAAGAGAVAGAQGGGGDTTSKTVQMDPRMAAMFYGTGPNDPNSVAGAGMNWWQANKSGINPTMQQALDAQRAIYTDPTAANSIRGIAQGLLSGPAAGNPFAQGSAAPQGLLGGYGAPQQSQGLLGAPMTQEEQQRRMRGIPTTNRMY